MTTPTATTATTIDLSTLTLFATPTEVNLAWEDQKHFGHWVSVYSGAVVFLLTVRHFFQRFTDTRSRLKAAKFPLHMAHLSRPRAVSGRSRSGSVGSRDSAEDDEEKENLITQSQFTDNTMRKGSASFYRKIQAWYRYLSYRRIPITVTQWFPTSTMPSSGMTFFLICSTAFLIGLIISRQNFYHETLQYGAPPVALRCALIATAMLPTQVALAGKANLVSYLTGIGHERLNIVHRWCGWASFGVSLVHGMPYFYKSESEYGPRAYEEIFNNYYRWIGIGGGVPYSGIPAILALGLLCVLSLHPLRSRAYEAFYGLHIFLVVVYVGGLLWHAANLVDSWHYVWATLALWFGSWLLRLLVTNTATSVRSRPILTPFQATLEPLAGGATRVRVWLGEGMDKRFKWRPGQHAFLRFTKMSPLQSHPFTIATSYQPEIGVGQEVLTDLTTGVGMYEPADDAAMSDASLSAPAGAKTHALHQDQSPQMHSRNVSSGSNGPGGLPMYNTRRFSDNLNVPGRNRGYSESATSLAPSNTFPPTPGAPVSRKPLNRPVEFLYSKHLTFLVRARKGITKRLNEYAKMHGGEAPTPVYLDGPFGGVPRPLELLYDTLVLCTGGSGITAATSWVAHLAYASVTGIPRTKRVHLMWTLRSTACVDWIEEILASALSQAKASGRLEIHCNFFVTKRDTPSFAYASQMNLPDIQPGNPRHSMSMPMTMPEQKTFEGSQSMQPDMSKSVYERRLMALGKLQYGRPKLAEEVNNAIRPGERAWVVGCGPDPMLVDLSNTCARAQKRVMSGEVEEIALHLESLGW